MAISYDGFAFPKGLPKAITKPAKKAEKDRALEDAYALVDTRDKKVCRATGRTLFAGAVMAQMRLERHHIKPRGTFPELRAEPSNIVTLAADCHQLVEAGLLEIEGEDSDAVLRFHWAKSLPADKRPFKLLSRRKSQREVA